MATAKKSSKKSSGLQLVEVSITRVARGKNKDKAVFTVYDAKTNVEIYKHPHVYNRRDNALVGCRTWCANNKKKISLWLK